MANEGSSIEKAADVFTKVLELGQRLAPFFQKFLGESLKTMGGIT